MGVRMSIGIGALPFWHRHASHRRSSLLACAPRRGGRQCATLAAGRGLTSRCAPASGTRASAARLCDVAAPRAPSRSRRAPCAPSRGRSRCTTAARTAAGSAVETPRARPAATKQMFSTLAPRAGNVFDSAQPVARSHRGRSAPGRSGPRKHSSSYLSHDLLFCLCLHVHRNPMSVCRTFCPSAACLPAYLPACLNLSVHVKTPPLTLARLRMRVRVRACVHSDAL
eukprot:2673938-Pleurochrysis_carterae.AAC.2